MRLVYGRGSTVEKGTCVLQRRRRHTATSLCSPLKECFVLKLKKLQILGFKSFCDRTELKFHGDGVAAIVGPNGCGKSNVADAISWVLGEQSAKSLRGIHMQDVIFAGTRDRKPTGMAEVSLTLIDPTAYEGDVHGEPQIEIRDDLPEYEDWDEAAERATAAEQTEVVTRETQPGVVLDEHGNPLSAEARQALEAAEAAQSQSQSDAEAGDPADEASGEAVPAEAAAPAAPETGTASAETGGSEGVMLKIRRRKFDTSKHRSGEIVITRRLFRSGDSEYLLNGKLCRLRDIQDIFMGTGLGPQSYAIIEQGRIGQILSSKPYDRRAIIEEAAGITRFKTKKRLAELRLEAARLNLSRINDIFDEVTRQVASLKRQAAKAERYARMRDELREKLRVVLASKFSHLSAEHAALQAEVETLTAGLKLRAEGITALEAQHQAAVARGYELDTEAQQKRTRLNEIAIESDRATARIRNNEERCAELAARSAADTAEMERTALQLTSLVSERDANRATVETAAADVAAAAAEAEASRQRSLEAARDLDSVELQQETRRASVLQEMGEMAALRNQITQAEEHISALDRDALRLEQECETSRTDADAMGGRRGQITLEFESLTDSVNTISRRASQIRDLLEEKRAAEAQSKKHLDTVRAEYATALGKRNSLETVIAQHGYSTESVKRLLKANTLEGGLAPAGVLADFLEVDGQYEGVVDEFLRDELNYVVVKSWASADEGMRLLRSDVDGRATFLVHPNDSQAKFSFVVDETTRHAPTRDSVVPLTRCIRVLNGFGKSLEVILPKLRDGYIVPDSSVARDLALENPDAFFLSPSGECFHNVTVTGGKQQSEGPLSLKRELRDVSKAVDELEAAVRTEEARVHTLSREIHELSALLERLLDERREAEKSAHSSSVALQQMEAELSRNQQRMQGYLLELDRVRRQRAEKEELAASKRDQVAGSEQRRQQFEMELAAAQQQLNDLRAARDAAAQGVSEANSKLAVLEERRRAAAGALDRIESLVREVTARSELLEAAIAGFAAEKSQREIENAAAAERLTGLGAERGSLEATLAELQSAIELVRAQAVELDRQLRGERAELDTLRDRRGELAAALARLESDMQHLSETCVNELSLPMQELRADATLVLLEGESLALSETETREMKTRLENMGPVNMMALEEFKEASERHTFLETQRKDLLDSIENTTNTIKEIEVVSRQKFEEAFNRINENFQIVFRKLFGGGQGFMRLTDQENSAESGIDIIASPPGKKLQNVLLLSGGEKALTAFALLVGIFQFQPSPFCILDEVDAPLDEANVTRFNELVREMSLQTQFILITHHKKTMGSAPVLYGVTMQEPGVSKIVSVRFGEPERAMQAATA
jgi:chromosome segregation protein